MVLHRLIKSPIAVILQDFSVSPLYRKAFSSRPSRHSEADLSIARKWLAEFNAQKVPRSHGEVTFSRSQGAGGQHVNTTDSKATLRYPVEALQRYVPKVLHSPLRASRYYVAASDSIRISASTERHQKTNVEECWKRLVGILQELAQASIPGETSQQQIEKVAKLQKAENTARLKMKKKHSDKKQARRSSTRGSDY